jgi:hypothetical protein
MDEIHSLDMENECFQEKNFANNKLQHQKFHQKRPQASRNHSISDFGE